MYDAYRRIFDRLGLRYVVVQADTGNIGGTQSHEFHVLAESGEDHLLVADDESFAANIEVCPAGDEPSSVVAGEPASMETFPTPGLRTIKELSAALQVPESSLVKTMFYDVNETDKAPLQPICVLLRGSDEVNPVKIKNLLKLANPPRLLTDGEVLGLTGAKPGSCGPIGLAVPVYMDRGVERMRNYVVGANRDDFHWRNVNHGRDYEVTAVADLRLAKEGDLAPNGRGRLKSHRGIEVGHVFYLGTKYSKMMNIKHLDRSGQGVMTEMGCYGIGVSRTVQAAVEQSHDADGIIWPSALAPFDVHVVLLDPSDVGVAELCDRVTAALESNGLEVLVDDRDERPGIKFKDADLLGMPLRINLGARGLAKGEAEIIVRRTREKKTVEPSRLVETILELGRAFRG
jgi:prolyl-tRNA synthetase